MTKLYEISNEYQVLNKLLDSDDVDQESLGLALKDIHGKMTDKCLAVAKYAENLKSDAAQIDIAIKQMQTRKKSLQNKSASMKEYLFNNMQASGITKVECPYFILSIKKNPPKVLIIDEALIPDKFLTEIITVSISKTAIKEAGGCPGAEIVQGERLDIK